MSTRLSICIMLAALTVNSYSQNSHAGNDKNGKNNDWLQEQYVISTQKLLVNISPADARAGAVIASPSRKDPDYYSHWVRDAALVMNTVFDQLVKSQSLVDYSLYRRKLENFVAFTETNQLTYAITGLGEPKFNVDGTSYTLPWGRPQNDGPALRALTLIRFANHLLDRKESKYVSERLYRNEIPANTVIKRDLEYVAHNWRDKSFDLWEEVKGDHFYTRMSQAHALLEGAQLAKRLGDDSAANYYTLQSNRIYHSLTQHYDYTRGQVMENIHFVEGHDYKHSGLDTATLLAMNQMALMSKSPLLPHDMPIMLATFAAIEKSFKALYDINFYYSSIGTAVGRYPEDKYYGGNPWFLTTTAMAEYLYNLREQMRLNVYEIHIDTLTLPFWQAVAQFAERSVTVSVGEKIPKQTEKFNLLYDAVVKKAETYFDRVKLHKGQGGQLDEQFHRTQGYMLSAYDLTWSYAAFLTAVDTRNKALRFYKSSPK